MIRTRVEDKIGRKKEEDLKIYRITIQVSAREKEKLKILASNRGMSVSDYVRYFCIHKPFGARFEDDFEVIE